MDNLILIGILFVALAFALWRWAPREESIWIGGYEWPL